MALARSTSVKLSLTNVAKYLLTYHLSLFINRQSTGPSFFSFRDEIGRFHGICLKFRIHQSK